MLKHIATSAVALFTAVPLASAGGLGTCSPADAAGNWQILLTLPPENMQWVREYACDVALAKTGRVTLKQCTTTGGDSVAKRAKGTIKVNGDCSVAVSFTIIRDEARLNEGISATLAISVARDRMSGFYTSTMHPGAEVAGRFEAIRQP